MIGSGDQPGHRGAARGGRGTVKAHLTAIFRKLGFTDRLQLGLYLAAPPKHKGSS
jgi:hypothetical protein